MIDVLDIVVVPIVLAVLALTWPAIQAWWRRRAFARLILRELAEVGPPPVEKMHPCKAWSAQLTKEFVHRKILFSETENRDFILSLDPTFVYLVYQLWVSRDNNDGEQWCHYLKELQRYLARLESRRADGRTPFSRWFRSFGLPPADLLADTQAKLNDAREAWDPVINPSQVTTT